MSQVIRTSDGVDLYVTVKGRGIPCLYLHGGPGSGSYWAEKFSDGLLEHHFQMVYLDQRGVARSASPRSADFGLDRMVQDFEEVREALGIQTWLTMGHSFGGLLQVGYAQRHPGVIAGMLMLNCTLNLLESFATSWIPKACQFLEIADPSPYLDASIPVFERLQPLADQLNATGRFWKMAYASQVSAETMNASFGEVPDWNHDQEEAFMRHAEYLQDYSAATAQLNMPVLFFYGLQDWMAGPSHYRCARFPNLLLWPSDVGHVAILENRPDLEQAITAFRHKFSM